MFYVSQRWICAASLMVVVQSLPSVPNYHQGREAVPVKTATQAMGLCAWVGYLTSIHLIYYNAE